MTPQNDGALMRKKVRRGGAAGGQAATFHLLSSEFRVLTLVQEERAHGGVSATRRPEMQIWKRVMPTAMGGPGRPG